MNARTRLGTCVLTAALTAAAAGQGIEAKPGKNQPPREAIEGVDAGQVIRRKTVQAATGFAPPQEETLPSGDELQTIEVDPEVERFVSLLGDPAYGVREQATAELLGRPFDNLQLYAILARGGLTAEQRHRLLAVVHDRLLNTPRGAVGIKIDNRGLPDKVIIQELLPGLPAREVLEIGDRITHLEGKPIESWTAFVKSVQSRRPGSTISVTVQRPMPGEAAEPKLKTLQIDIKLGSTDLLVDPMTGRPSPGGPVYNERKNEADLVMQRWGANPRMIQIE